MGSSQAKPKVSEEEKYHLDQNDPFLDAKSYPKTDIGHTIALKDSDRKLGYMICGRREHYRATVLLLPGSPGTRLFNHGSHDKINQAYGIRMIVLDRPGIGLSSYHQDYSFKSYAHDVFQLVQQLQLHTYHLVAYSAGGPFACHYAGMYGKHSEYVLKSFSLVSGVGPPETPKPYGQMNFINKAGWFLVRHGSKKMIEVAADASSDASKPIECMVKEFSRGDYDTEMMKEPAIIRSFLISKYETEATEAEYKEDKPECRLLVLYGTPWDDVWKNIACPLYVYNGCEDIGCVANMATYMFESITGKQAPSLPVASAQDQEQKTDLDIAGNTAASVMDKNENVPTCNIAVDIKEEDADSDQENGNDMEFMSDDSVMLPVDEQVLNELEKEYTENERLQEKKVKNKQSRLIWGASKGHLWFFEQDLWREIVFRVLFLQDK